MRPSLNQDSAPRIRIALLGTALIVLTPLALYVHGRWDADYAFVVFVLVQGAVFLFAARSVRSVPRGPAAFAIVVSVAVILRLSLLFATPIHSTDVYRYVWDGRVQAENINPYRYVPANPALAALRDAEIYPNINRADYAVTIYPPAAQVAFWLFTRAGDSVWAVKLGWLLVEAAAMAVIVRLLARNGRAPAELLLYAWHPLPLWEIACDGHVDAGMMAFLVFALWAWDRQRRLLTGALLAASVLFKPLTLAAAPAFWRPWDWGVIVAFCGVAVLAYLPYADVGTGVIGFLPRYFGEEGIGSGQGFFLLHLLALVGGPLPTMATPVYLALSGTILASLAIRCILDRCADATTAARQALVLAFAFLLVLSPNYPWYFLVLVPLGCLAPWMPAQLLTILGVILYAAPPLDAAPRTLLVQGILYASVVTAVIFDVYPRRRAFPASVSTAKDGP